MRKSIIVIVSILMSMLSASVGFTQVCTGVGYTPAQFAGKPDPWPGNLPLPNDQLYAAYFARYGQHPGNPSVPEGKVVPGYFDELSFVAYGALEDAGNASAIGPGGEHLHPGCPTTTEQTDFAFAVPKGSPYVFTWYVSRLDGSSPSNAITQHDATKPCGLSSVTKALFGYWTIYYTNPAPCGGEGGNGGGGNGGGGGGGGGNPTPVCGDGHLDPGENCQNCPADAGVCPCPPPPPPPPPTCPTLAAIPDTTQKNCVNLLAQIRTTGRAGWVAALKDICGLIGREQAYQPVNP